MSDLGQKVLSESSTPPERAHFELLSVLLILKLKLCNSRYSQQIKTVEKIT